MQISGRVWKDGKFWVIHCPALDGSTQGFSKKEALDMMVDWVRSMLSDQNYAVEIEARGKDEFVMSFADPRPVLALMFAQLRASKGKTLQEVAAALGSKNHGSVRQYETGKHDPGISKLVALMSALDFDVEIMVRPRVAKRRAG